MQACTCFTLHSRAWEAVRIPGHSPSTPRPLVSNRSCLHAWQLQRLNANPLADVATCDVCRQPYNVPEQQWDALVAAGGIDERERQRVREQRRLPQALAKLLHAMRLGNGWFTTTVKLVLWYCHALPSVFDSSELPSTEPPRPSVLHRLLSNGCVTAGVLAILALSERQQLGSWEAVWRECYSAQFAKRTAWQLSCLALFTWVGHAADPGHNTPGAPSHQPELAALAEGLATFCLFLASMSLSHWPSLLSLMRWVPLACWAALRSMLSWLPQAYWAALCRLFRPVPFPPAPPINWPVMPALFECARLLDALGAQEREDKERTATARQCLALLLQRPQALRRFADACAPRSPSLFARVCSKLSRFLPFLAPPK